MGEVLHGCGGIVYNLLGYLEVCTAFSIITVPFIAGILGLKGNRSSFLAFIISFIIVYLGLSLMIPEHPFKGKVIFGV